MASATAAPNAPAGTHPSRNKTAGRLLASRRIDLGYSPEGMSWEMGVRGFGFVSGRQIRRIENDGVIPTPRTMFAIASFFETSPSAIWFRRRGGA